MNIRNTPVFRLLFNDGSVEYYPVSDYSDGKISIDGKLYTIAQSNLCR
jgi:hypothetical protein